MVSELAARIARVRERIARAALRSGRQPEDVTLVAVTKGVDPARILEAAACGITDVGENRVQEAAAKIQALGEVAARLRWHLVGHLQRNKARQAAQLFALIHSVDRLALGEELSRRTRRPLEVLVQVNVAGEPQKFGVAPADAAELVRALSRLPGLRVVGLMTIAPVADDPEAVRPVFARLRELRDDLARRGVADLPHLSMGMSQDFDVAVEEGATMVRIGRALFGPAP
ncbi:MAG: YggS family pyridoxal phosphate-dependent enzyme [Armatimonadota bacterium]|nr:YggS family pyridoxal phosphate-dependent enzyme [Armatimonadota bacterium]MDR7436791.1 YggS family pyridoxal phosphate-dependent enzyme [Armatimonadota bacterium]MDR7472738.1 YggS family pyridoxal phosphate-dependent enzyme [Armatimonadota bacterium]MDR7506971.1 YggS family pyridoxal phosphate-dependent enzyme [Armatimonadota bacterium]MDR7508832.1 YggS family pyridoxal phosphate-dependent enzyme [Armatimonadota bacterium]